MDLWLGRLQLRTIAAGVCGDLPAAINALVHRRAVVTPI